MAHLEGLAHEIEAAVIVKQHLREAYGEAARAFDQRFREAVEALQRMRALQTLAREQFNRAVLPHVEPSTLQSRPEQVLGLEDLLWKWASARIRVKNSRISACANNRAVRTPTVYETTGK